MLEKEIEKYSAITFNEYEVKNEKLTIKNMKIF